MAAFEQQLSTAEIKFQRLNVPQAFHTPLMSESSKNFSKSISEIEILAPTVPMLSGIAGQYMDHPESIRKRWSTNWSSRCVMLRW